MDEALLKSGQYPNVAIMAGSDPKEVMQEYANDNSRDALKEQINRYNASKSEDNAENDTSKGVINKFDVQNDTREKLEADVKETIDFWGAAYPDARVCVALSWLDRQAAITEREAFMRGRASLDDEFAELTAERD